MYINKRILNEVCESLSLSLLSYYRVGISGYLINATGALFKECLILVYDCSQEHIGRT